MNINVNYILFQYALIFKAKLQMSVPDFKPLIDSFEKCKPDCDDDIVEALQAFANFWEFYELPINLTEAQSCIFGIIKEHFMPSNEPL